jgi:hypothetical protein
VIVGMMFRVFAPLSLRQQSIAIQYEHRTTSSLLIHFPFIALK